jgi:hypothetical protein
MQLATDLLAPIFNGPEDPHGRPGIVPVTRIPGLGSIGYVDWIHGDAGAPCPGYVPTKHELAILARHWAGVLVGNDHFMRSYEVCGSLELRESVYSGSRLDEIGDCLGTEALRQICCEVGTKLRGETSAANDSNTTLEAHNAPHPQATASGHAIREVPEEGDE